MMRDRDDFEELLEATTDDGRGDAVAGDPLLTDQLEIDRLLRATVARRPPPALSAGFDHTLVRRLRRLRRHPARRRLRGRALVLMTSYWLAFGVLVAVVLAGLDPPLPPMSPWTLALWSLLVPVTCTLPLLRRRPRKRLRRAFSV